MKTLDAAILFLATLCLLTSDIHSVESEQHFVHNFNRIEPYQYEIKKFTVPVDHFSFALHDTFELRYLVNNTWQHGNNSPIFFYTGNEGDIEMFTQNSVDHFSFALHDTFELRYLVNNTWQHGNNSPIFFYTGNEGDIEMFTQNSGFMWEIAPSFGALLIFAEHRYYGESLPYKNLSFTEPKYLGYLTAQQAMADYVDLIQFIKSDQNLLHSPVIAFGGSYGGMLSAYIRMKYPHIIQGAIAASAPLLSFPGMTDCLAYSRIVTSDFQSANPECTRQIRQSWETISYFTSTVEGKNWLSDNWKLCKPLKTKLDIDVLKSWLADVYSTLAMLDYPYPTNFLRPLPAKPISAFCEHLVDPNLVGKSKLIALGKAIKVYANYSGQISCLSVDDAGPDLGVDGWTYQACTEMVMPMCSDGIHDMFEPLPWNSKQYSDNCYEKFKVRPQTDLACTTYGCKDLSAATNIVFSNGLRDPWSSGGILKNMSASAVAVIIPEGAHHLDLRGSNPNDPYSVIEARNFHVFTIKKWIREYLGNTVFRFNENERVLHAYSSTGSEIIAARLGVGISHETDAFPCLTHHQRKDAVCLEWFGQTRLYLAHSTRDDMHCYHVTWQSLSENFNPKDCFDWSASRGHWYGAGQIKNASYPLEAGRLDLSPFITGDIKKHPFGNVLKRYFLNSNGAMILVDPDSPLYVSIKANQSKEFCMQAKHDAFAYINHLTPLPQLNYTICAADNIKNLHSSMAEKSLWDGLKPEELKVVHSLLSEPVWQISSTTEAAIYNYTEDVISLGYFRQGHILLSEEWQPNPGDFILDNTRFPSMEDTINILHRRGFKLIFTVHPFISTESINFKGAVANQLLISERDSDSRIPALTRYRQSNSAGVLDITNNKTLPWLQTKLESLVKTYPVDSFYLDLGTAQDMPHYYKCKKPLTNPDHYKTLFTKSVLGSIPVIGVSSTISRPQRPVFVSLPPFPSSWEAIKTVIPTVLSYGMIGYPFIMPGAVGGDVAPSMSNNNSDNDVQVKLPNKELYVRWLQLSTFLPVIRFMHLPSKYSDKSVLEIAKNLTELREKIVTPLLKKYANETFDSGLPIIRPLWMLDPADQACHVVVDEFSIGEELIVAPVLDSGSRQRNVYLPAGVWKDGIDGSLRKGSKWINNYRVAVDQIAYFFKTQDNRD